MSTVSRRPMTSALRGAWPGDLLRRLAEADAEGSFSNTRRTRRFQAFAQLVEELAERQTRPVRILDIGGTNTFWEQRGWADREDVEITLVNVEPQPRAHATIDPRVGDATDLGDFADGSFDVVFSNSVIEHLETFERQAAMAGEVRRLAPRYWVQTPNFWFPVEPHFLTPAWHWLPIGVRVTMLRRRRWGWRGPCPDVGEARAAVREVRLMRGSEVRELFAGATIRTERIGPFVKSFVAVR
jgi:methyltransferase family protein